jgi:hypothetical protein
MQGVAEALKQLRNGLETGAVSAGSKRENSWIPKAEESADFFPALTRI